MWCIGAAAEECTLNDVVYHLARDAGITTYNDAKSFGVILACNESCVGNCELHDVDWGEVFAYLATDGTTDTGDRFNESHSSMFLFSIKKLSIYFEIPCKCTNFMPNIQGYKR